MNTDQWDNNSLIGEYMKNRRHDWRPETRRVRTYQLKAISDQIPELITVTSDDLINWYDQLSGSNETIGQYVSTVRGLCGWMARRRIRDDNPAFVLDRPSVPKRQPRPMLEKHYELAIACALSEPELYVWLGLMGCSGFRCCEIAWARTYEVEAQADNGGIARVVGKGGKRRAIPIGSNLMLSLRPFLAGSGPIFTKENGDAWTPAAVSKRTNRFLRSLNIPETAHSLRHRFGTDYHAIDPDVFRQAAIMGHASVNTTLLYTEVTPAAAAEYVDMLTRRRLSRGA